MNEYIYVLDKDDSYSNTPHEEKMIDKLITAYDCRKCQVTHYQGDWEYDDHIPFTIIGSNRGVLLLDFLDKRERLAQ